MADHRPPVGVLGSHPQVADHPSHASLLFGALADSGRIRQRKNGSYRMILKGVDEINWFTDRPNRVEGKWKPGKLLRKWNSYFANSEPNAQTTLEVDGEKEIVTFEMFKPKIKKGKMVFNIKPISDSGEDLLTGLKGKKLGDISLFVDESSDTPSCNLAEAYLEGVVLQYAGLNNANLKGAELIDALLYHSNLANANLADANLYGADLNSANLANANLAGANLAGATLLDAIWDNTTCPDGTNSDSNPSCGF